MAYEDRLSEYRTRVHEPEFKRHVVTRMRKLYPAIPAETDPDEVITRYKASFAPDMGDEDFQKRLTDAYGTDFTPSQPSPEPNLIEKAQIIAPQVPRIAGEMGKAIAPFAGAAGIQAITKVPLVGQGVMAAMTGLELGSRQLTSASLEKTAREMPAPNIDVLRAKGYTPAQIANVFRGYAAVQQSLAEDLQKTGEESVSKFAEGAANALTFGVTGKWVGEAAARVTGGGLAKAGVKGFVGKVAGEAAKHTATGGLLGGTYGMIHTATERMAQAKEAGLGANDILSAGVSGGVEGAKSGAVLGAIVGGTIGTPLAVISTGVAANKAASAARKAHAAQVVEDALNINLKKFSSEFQPHQLSERFPEELAAAAGDDLALAQNLVAGVWGPEVAATEKGMKAASAIYEKLLAWRGARERLGGPMVDLPTAVEAPQASITPTLTPEQQTMGLEPTALPSRAPGVVAPAQGLITGQPGVPMPEPNVVGQFQPEAGPQPFVPPQGTIVPMKGTQPVGEAVPSPVPAPVVPEGLAPPAPIGPTLTTPFAPEPRRPIGPAEQMRAEPAPRTLPPAPPGPATPPNLSQPSGLAAGAERAVAISSTPEERAAFRAAQAVPSSPTEGSPQVHRAVEEMKTLGEPTGTPDTRVIGDVEFRVSPSVRGDALELNYIRNVGSEKGAASKAMEKITALADQHGLPVVVDASPLMAKGGKMPIAKLVAWYEKHGFESVGETKAGTILMRRAPELPTLAQRTLDLPPAEAKMAAGNVTPGAPQVHAGFGERLGKALDAQAEAARKRLAARGTRLYSMGFDAEAIADHSVIVAAEMFSKGLRAKSAVSAWMIDKWGEEIRPHVKAIYDKAQARLLKMFKTEGNAQKKLAQLVSLRDSGAHGMDWYETTAEYVQKEFGEDADMFMRFLSATSAGSSTEAGSTLSLKAFGQWKQGFPFDGMRGQHMVMMLDQAARGESFGGDKVASFYRALKGDKDAVVLDRWMIHALGLPMKKGALGENDYKLYSQIVKNLAADANMSPRQFQASIWEGARVGEAHLRWKKGGAYAASKIGSARPLEQLLQREFNGMTPYQWVEVNRMKLEDLSNMSAGMKAAREGDGYTFNPGDWSTDKTPGYVVTLISDVVPKKEFYPGALTKFKAQVQKLISVAAFGDSHLNIGAFDMGEYKPGHFSLDLNVVVPNTGPEALAKAQAIGKLNRQYQIGEIGPDGNYVTGHDTGYNPKAHGPQFVPPAKGAERAAWFKTAIGRARTLLDHIDFKME